MTSYREYISQIKDLFKEINADSRLTNKQVYSLLIKHAKWVIYRDSDKLKLLSQNTIFKWVNCLNVKEVPASECGDIGKNCKVFRTVDKLPELFEDSAGVIIASITSSDGWSDIVLTTAKEIKRNRNNPWAKKTKDNKIYAYYNNGYIYFPEKKLNVINVQGLFSGPVPQKDSCTPCKDCEGKCDKFLDGPAPIPDYLAAQVIDYVIKDLANTYEKIPEKSHEINKNSNSPN